MGKRIINMGVIKGEPLDGSGRVCIHLFVQDNKGLIVEPHVLHPIIKDGVAVKQKLEAKPTRGRLACNPLRGVAPIVRGGVTTITPRTTDPRAVTCTKCKESKDYKEMITVLE